MTTLSRMSRERIYKIGNYTCVDVFVVGLFGQNFKNKINRLLFNNLKRDVNIIKLASIRDHYSELCTDNSQYNENCTNTNYTRVETDPGRGRRSNFESASLMIGSVLICALNRYGLKSPAARKFVVVNGISASEAGTRAGWESMNLRVIGIVEINRRMASC